MFNENFRLLKRLLFLFVFLGILMSCDSESKPATFKMTSIDEEYDADIKVTLEEAQGNSDLSKTINFNVEKAIIGTLADPEKKTKLEAVLEDFNEEYENFTEELPDDASEQKWELHIETEKTYQSEDIITITISTYEYKGGAHGNDKIKFLNLNAKTGDVYTQNDLIEDVEGFTELAKTHFVKSLKIKNNEAKIEDYFFGKPFQLPENIGFSEDGIVVLYNQYEITSYNQGYTEFVIPFDKAEPFLKVF